MLTVMSELSGIVWPVLGALIAGGIIGFEREWRGRPAGLRTHILVSLASALLMLASMSQADWAFEALPDENIVTDPTRMAHGILTGIGFLCAGVIFRTGFSIHGLTTAASLWITSAVGVLFGAGLYGLGALGAIVTTAVLVGLRLINSKMPGRLVADVDVLWSRDSSDCGGAVETCVMELDDEARPQKFEMIDAGRTVRQTWRVTYAEPQNVAQLAERLGSLPGITGFRLAPRED